MRVLMHLCVIVVLLIGSMASGLGAGQSARELFERARLLEAANQNSAEIIKLYEQAAAAADKSDPALAAAARARVAALRVSQEPVDRSVLVTDSFRPMDVSADGRTVVGMNLAGDIETRDLATGAAQVVVPATPERTAQFPVISRDGRFVAYGTIAAGPAPRAVTLSVIGTEKGARPRVLIAKSSGPTYLPAAWSPAGPSILVGHGTGANTGAAGQVPQEPDWVSATDGSVSPIKTFELARNPAGFALSHDGRWIAYSIAPASPQTPLDMNIRVLSADGQSDETVVTQAGNNVQPKWAPDGRHVFFIGDRSGSGLWSVAVENGRAAGEPSLVRAGIQRGLVGVSAIGSLYYSRTSGNEITTFVVDRTSAGAEVIHAFNGDRPVLSPDGRSVAFIRYLAPKDGARARPQELTVRSLETGEERGYPRPDIDRQSPIRWKPDGTGLVVFVTAEAGAEAGGAFHELNLKSGSFTQLISRDTAMHRRSNSGALSPDGKTMYMAARRDVGAVTQIVAVDVPTNAEQVVMAFPIPGLPATILSGSGGEVGPQLALSPDGKILSLMTLEGPERTHLYFLNADGSGFREVTQPESGLLTGPAVWSDNQALVCGVAGQTGTVALRVFVDGRAPEPLDLNLTRLVGRVSFPRIDAKTGGGVSVSHNGSRLAFSATSLVSNELWALENVMKMVK